MPLDPRAAALIASAQRIGANPVDLATVISYETGGKFDPSIRGGAGNRHIGLIQFGPNEQQQYGASQDQTFEQQLPAVEKYLTSRGFQPGMGIHDLYSTINAGRPGLYNASDANNGGAPGTVADKVNNQMAGHRAKAEALLGGDYSFSANPAPRQIPGDAAASGKFSVSGVEGSTVPTPTMATPNEPADEPINAAKILSALSQSGGLGQAAAQSQPAPVQQIAPLPRRAAPFDAASFFALLKR
jgi:hypothetical protein